MTYTAEISRANPSCFVFLVDQSASMNDPIGGGRQRKADVVADALNRLLAELSVKCAKEEGVRDYFHVAVIGYGHAVGSAFTGPLAGRDLVPLSQVVEVPQTREALRLEVLGGLAHPYLVVRIGWQAIGRSQLPHTPRRPVDEVLEPA